MVMIRCPLCGNQAAGNTAAKYLCRQCNVLLDDRMIGLFLGRFQPFHNGHLELIKRASLDVEKLVIVIGSSLKRDTKENPFTAEERKEMIEAALAGEGITNYMIVPVNDILLDDEYVNHVRQLTPAFNVVYAGQNQLTAELFGKAGFEIRKCERYFDLEATQIRRLMVFGKEWRHLVPKKTVEVIERIGGVNRIKKLNMF